MKKIFLSVAIAITLNNGISGQVAEINDLFSALQESMKSKDLAKARQLFPIAKKAVEGQEKYIEPEQMAKYVVSAARMGIDSGDSLYAAKVGSLIYDYELRNMYQVRNKITKKSEYYFDKAEAEKVIKSQDYTQLIKLLEPVTFLYPMFVDQKRVIDEINKSLESSPKYYNEKKYYQAARGFLGIYYGYRLIGKDVPLYKYLAANSARLDGLKKEALVDYQELIDQGFTGVIEGSKSYEEELYVNTAITYNEMKNTDKALEISEKGLTKFPKNESLIALSSKLYFALGKKDKLLNNLQESLKVNANDPQSLYNVGVLQMNDPALQNDAMESFKKAISLKPDFADAHYNLISMLLAPGKKIEDDINKNLGNTPKEKAIYEKANVQLKDMYKTALPYLEKAVNGVPKDISLLISLKSAYNALDMSEKLKEVKAKEITLRAELKK